MALQTISVVVPTHNRVNKLKCLLNSIDNLKIPPKEVIVVNDGSSDKTSKILENWLISDHFFTPIAVNNKSSKGPAVARNIGICTSSGDLIAFTDDDCIVHKLWIKVIINSKLWKNKNVVGIGGKVLPYRKGIISEYFTFHRILQPPKYNQYLVTANACYIRKHLVEVDGFNEFHKYPGGEDNGLSFKLANLGYVFKYEKDMIVWHDYRSSLYSFIKTFYRYGKGCAEITNKYEKHLKKHNLRTKL